MAPPTRLVTNVLVGYSNMYIAPVGTAKPADTVAYNTDWATALPAWYFPGYTEKGLTLNFDRKEKRHMVEEISNPAQISTESSAFKVQFGLAESTLENMKYAFGSGTVTTQAAASSIIGKKTLVLSDDLEVFTLGFEAKNPQGFFRRVIIPRVVSVGKIKSEFDRAKNYQVWNCEFEAICPIDSIEIYEKTANALP